MKPPFAYYGGKMRMAPWIASLLPPHQVYLEPFAGSAAVLFAKVPARHEIINDQLGGVVTFFRVLRERPLDLERACRLTPYASDEFNQADYTAEGLDDVEVARRFYIRTTQSFNQTPSLTSRSTWSVSAKQGGSTAGGTQRAVERFAACAERLLNVSIDNMDGREFIKRHQSAEAVIYVDPPYLGSTRSRARDYGVEFPTEADHRSLAEVLIASPATVLLSGYASPLYEALYDGWHRVERTVHAPAANHGAGALHRTEVLWSNRPLAQHEQPQLNLTGANP